MSFKCFVLFLIVFVISIKRSEQFFNLQGVLDSIFEAFRSERCSPYFASRVDEDALRRNLSSLVFGQPFVIREMVTLIADHRRINAYNEKPLVMSFHGSQGTGKNFVSQIIIDHLFLRGGNSKFVHYFNGRMHFTSRSSIDDDRESLMYVVQTSLRQCPYSAFIFDELEKFPSSILDDIKHIIDYNTFNLAGIDCRKALFIFLSNSGMEAINKKAYELWSANVDRNDFKFRDFKNLITEVYHADGALKNSKLIESSLIDFYVPFLPLEKKHVVQCIKSEGRRLGYSSVTSEQIK